EGDFPSPTWIGTETDADGAFALAHLPPSGGTVLAFAPGFALARRDADALPGEPELVLARGASLRGRISFPGGRAAAGVRIACEPVYKANEWCTGLPGYDAAWRGFGETARTDADGRFELAGVLAGARMVWAVDDASGLVASTALDLADGVQTPWDA